MDASEISPAYYDPASKTLMILDLDEDYARSNTGASLADTGAWARCHASCSGGTVTGLTEDCREGTQYCGGGILSSTIYGWLNLDWSSGMQPIPLDDGDNYLIAELTKAGSEPSPAKLMIRVP